MKTLSPEISPQASKIVKHQGVGRIFYTIGTDPDYQNYHREDGPAIINDDGTQEYYRFGQRHRTDGPALIFPNGTEIWIRNNLRFREDGPAVIVPSEYEVWYYANMKHRVDGPAYINHKTGVQEFWEFGELVK